MHFGGFIPVGLCTTVLSEMQIADTDNVCEEYYLSDKATTALTPMPSQSAGECRWRMNYQE